MPPHAVPRYADSAAVKLRKRLEERFRQLVRDVAVHLVTLRPGFFSGIDIEACARAEVVGVVFALDLEAAWGNMLMIALALESGPVVS